MQSIPEDVKALQHREYYVVVTKQMGRMLCHCLIKQQSLTTLGSLW